MALALLDMRMDHVA